MAEMKTLTINDVKYDITDANAVKFVPQELTEEQKAQARENIGAQAEIVGTEEQIIGFDKNGNTVPISFFDVSNHDAMVVTIASETTGEGVNMANPNTAIAGKSHNYNLSTRAYEEIDKVNYYLFDYIPVEYGKTYCATVYFRDTHYPSWVSEVYGFDENKNFVNKPGYSSTTATVTITQSNIKYVRFAANQVYSDQVYFGEGDTLPAEFIAYIDPSDEPIGEAARVIKKELFPILGADKLNPFTSANNLYDYKKRTIGKSISDGALIDNAQYDSSDFIIVKPSTTYAVASYRQANEKWNYDVITWVYCYDSEKNYLTRVSTASGVFTTPDGCIFVRFPMFVAGLPEFSTSTLLIEGDTLPRYFIPYAADYRLRDEYMSELMRQHNKWRGKIFVSYGDSIVHQGFWQTYVGSYFDLIHLKRGVGGSGFVGGVSKWWANSDGSYNKVYYTGDTAPDGATLVEASFISDERIEMCIPTDADLIIIAGGTNDQGTDIPLGDMTYTVTDGVPVFDTTTFKGAVCTCVYKIMQRCPNAIVMLQTPPNTRSTNMVQGVNGIGLTILDYVKAIKECAEFMSVPCIDVYGESGLNQFNLVDNGAGLHPNDAGHRKMARAVIAKLKSYEPCDYPFVIE